MKIPEDVVLCGCNGLRGNFPEIDASEVWNMYDPSDECRFVKDDFCHAER